MQIINNERFDPSKFQIQGLLNNKLETISAEANIDSFNLILYKLQAFDMVRNIKINFEKISQIYEELFTFIKFVFHI